MQLIAAAYPRMFSLRWVSVCVCLLLADGCGKKNAIDGTYHDSSGLMTFYFNRGSAEITIIGMTKEYDYEVVGNRVTLRRDIDGRAQMEFIINPDGSLLDPKSGNIAKKSDS
jgi:hypothetical protein